MNKKIASLVGAGAILMSVVGTTFAFDWSWMDMFSNDVRVRNYARVSNDVEVKSDSGDNEIGGWKVFGGNIDTGSALSVGEVANVVNTTGLGGTDGDLSVRNYARVWNKLEVKSDSGDNTVHGGWVFGGNIETGNTEAGGMVENVINTTTTVGVE